MASLTDIASPDEFTVITQSVQRALVKTTQAANVLANEDLQFQRTVNPRVAKRLDACGSRLLNLANGLLKSGARKDQRAPILEDVDDIEVQWRGIVDVIDGLLEQADTCLDDYTGLVKRKVAPTTEPGRDTKRSRTALDPFLKRANIIKPQDAFEKKPDNFEPGPWKPLLTRKPHAKRSLEDSLKVVSTEEGNSYTHPYEIEILESPYPRSVYEKREPQMYLPVESTKAIWVDTWEGVLEMLEELKQAKEIAIDLEHHDLRTYVGLLSLMQISTRGKDWIVDTLVPWRHKLEVLNEVFADPNVVKVMHGAYMDIIWLQRDLGLYVVGLFDTYHACWFLEYSGKSLAYLLDRFVNFTADKKYQLADWRIRPLPEEMMFYAQCDTHFLLYIWDRLCDELVERSDRNDPEKDLIGKVISKSQEVALQRYETAVYNPEDGFNPRGWLNTLLKSPALYNGEQFAVYQAVHRWRDEMARRKDENPLFIMSQQILADIARIIPDDKMALWNLLTGSAASLRKQIDELLAVIRKARADGVNGPTMLEFFKAYQDNGDQKMALVKLTGASPKDEKLPDIKDLKLERSQLFGNVPVSTRYDGSSKPLATDVIVLPYPVPQNGMTISLGQPPKETPKPATLAAGHPTVNDAEDQEFTLKGGMKRKLDDRDIGAQSELDTSQAAESGSSKPMAVDEDNEASDTENSDEEDKKQRRAEKKRIKQDAKDARAAAKVEKKARKAEKKAARERERAAQEASTEDAGEEAFDYSRAESVLHASKADSKGSGKGKKTFNPYSDKSGDAPKGERRLGLVKTGKTATFKK